MRWQDLRRSSNVENRRGMGSKTVVGGAGGMFLMALVVFALGGDPTKFLIEGVSRSIQSSQSRPSNLNEEQLAQEADFSAAVLGSTEDVWGQIYRQHGQNYPAPRMVLFGGATDTACGTGQSAMGPFYCPSDQSVYLDLDFFHELEHNYNAPGDFARAYVIAHEVGHHVQHTQGTLAKRKTNQDSIQIELQADCYAGIWASTIAEFGALDDGDIEEAINAAGQVGDDRLQEKAQGYAVPDSFTHGTAKQRMAAFKRGYSAKDLSACNNF
jgi:predicted metalloprotease